jgi:hypothetical protein
MTSQPAALLLATLDVVPLSTITRKRGIPNVPGNLA